MGRSVGHPLLIARTSRARDTQAVGADTPRRIAALERWSDGAAPDGFELHLASVQLQQVTTGEANTPSDITQREQGLQ